MIECNEGRCNINGTLEEILAETVAVLVVTHKICKKELGEEKANVAFAAIGKTAIEYDEMKEGLSIV